MRPAGDGLHEPLPVLPLLAAAVSVQPLGFRFRRGRFRQRGDGAGHPQGCRDWLARLPLGSNPCQGTHTEGFVFDSCRMQTAIPTSTSSLSNSLPPCRKKCHAASLNRRPRLPAAPEAGCPRAVLCPSRPGLGSISSGDHGSPTQAEVYPEDGKLHLDWENRHLVYWGREQEESLIHFPMSEQ